MITITEQAAKEIKTIVASQQLDDTEENVYLRVGVRGGGCSGFQYSLDLTSEKSDDDEIFEQHGIAVLCDAKSHIYLNGTTVDFRDELMGRGFVFNNPNASSKCGCGSSFNI